MWLAGTDPAGTALAGTDGVQVRFTCESPAAAVKQNLGAAAAAGSREEAPAVVPPATIAGRPSMVTARHIPARARGNGPRRRHRVSRGKLDSSTFRPS